MNNPTTPPAAPTPREQAFAILRADCSLDNYGKAIRLLRNDTEALAIIAPSLSAAIDDVMLRWNMATQPTGIA